VTFNANLFTIRKSSKWPTGTKCLKGHASPERDRYMSYTQATLRLINFIWISEVLIVILMEIHVFLGMTP